MKVKFQVNHKIAVEVTINEPIDYRAKSICCNTIYPNKPTPNVTAVQNEATTL